MWQLDSWSWARCLPQWLSNATLLMCNMQSFGDRISIKLVCNNSSIIELWGTLFWLSDNIRQIVVSHLAVLDLVKRQKHWWTQEFYLFAIKSFKTLTYIYFELCGATLFTAIILLFVRTPEMPHFLWLCLCVLELTLLHPLHPLLPSAFGN